MVFSSLHTSMGLGTFPLTKLGFILLQQITHPIVRKIVAQTKVNKILHNYCCIPIAQAFYRCDVRIRFRYVPHNLGGSINKIPRLDDKKAINIGAYIITEIFILLSIVTVAFVEYSKYVENDMAQQKQLKNEQRQFCKRLKKLETEICQNSAQLTELLQFSHLLKHYIHCGDCSKSIKA